MKNPRSFQRPPSPDSNPERDYCAGVPLVASTNRYLTLIFALTLILCSLTSTSYGAWGYYGTFYYPVDQLGAFNYSNFSPTVYKSANARLLTWNTAPPYSVLMQGTSAFPADFAITPGITQTSNFINYRAFSYYRLLDNSVGTLGLRPGAGTYGFGTRNQQAYTHRFNVDYFKSFAYTTHKLPDYVAGINYARTGSAYNSRAWVRGPGVATGAVAFPLIESPSRREHRKYIHSLSIPAQTSAGTYYRYVWHCTSQLSASTASAVYIIAPSQYDNFINYRGFSYFKTWTNGSGSELRLPYGTYYVVARNGINTYAIDAGSVASYVIRYN